MTCKWIGTALSVLACVSASAAEVSPESEYFKKQKFAGTIQPLGEHPFGEIVNMFNGELSFHVADITIPGAGPSIELARTTLKVERMRGFDPGLLGNWDLSIPRIETMIPAATRFDSSAPGDPGALWTVGQGSVARCSEFDVLGGDNWWAGYELIGAGGGRQPLLKRDASNSAKPSLVDAQGNPIKFPAVTQNNWQIGCLPTTSNNEVGEAFLAVAPDGTRYYLDHLVGVRADTVVEILPSPALSASGMSPRAGPVRSWFPRQFAAMYVSRIEDRYGNTVNFIYSGRKLTSISASDGRQISFVWRADAPLIDHIIVQPGANQRIWKYEYVGVENIANEGWRATLATVVLPDNSRWTYSAGIPEGRLYNPNLCTTRGGLADDTTTRSITITHPSGLVGVFTTQLKWHGRSYVPSNCDVPEGGASTTEGIPLLMSNATLISKTFSGPGIATGSWSYAYSPAIGSALRDLCAASSSCPDSRWVDVTEPDGTKNRYTVSTRWGVMQGKALSTETFGSAGILQLTDETTYASPDVGPFPARLGTMLGASYGTNVDAIERLAPAKGRTITLQGRKFSWEVPMACGSNGAVGIGLCLDAFARPTRVIKASAPTP